MKHFWKLAPGYRAKAFVLYFITLILVSAPLYSVYAFWQGEGRQYSQQWWEDNLSFICWALGSYIILLLCTFASRINWAQIGVLAAGTICLPVFYLVPSIYQFFLNLPFFMANKQGLPLVPYLFCVTITALAVLLRSPRAEKKGIRHIR